MSVRSPLAQSGSLVSTDLTVWPSPSKATSEVTFVVEVIALVVVTLGEGVEEL